MIEKIEHTQDLEGMPQDVFSCRIRSIADAYGVDTPFAQFWKQEPGAILCRLDDAAVLSAHPDADFEEVQSFLQVIGAKRLLCKAEFAEKMAFPVLEAGKVMVYTRGTELLSENCEQDPPLREVHELLSRCASRNFVPPEFESFYLDMSHRIRHGTAYCVGIRKDGVLAGCAICSAKTGNTAILSAIAVLPAYRRTGLGTEAVKGVIASLPQETFYILRREKENKAFYQSLGFSDIQSFAELGLL